MGGLVCGCVKGIKVLGKYVDFKWLNMIGVSVGCIVDLLVGCVMIFYGYGFFYLVFLNVVFFIGDVYFGFGFYSV